MIGRWLGKRPGVLIIGVIVVALFLLHGTHGLEFSGYAQQWELKSDIVGIGSRVGPPTAQSQYLHVIATDEYIKQFSGTASSAIWDFDASNWGQADIRVTLGGVREEVSKLAEPTWTKSGFQYVTEMHEYLQDVEIKTAATVEHVGNYWYHETAMPHTWADNFGSGGTQIGTHAAGYVYVRFANSPWGLVDFGPAPAGYKWTETYWFGIMEAALETRVGGPVPTDTPVEENFHGFSNDVTSGQAFFNMHLDDGTFVKPYAKIPYTDMDKILDPDIQQAVIVALPYDLLAGADDQYSTWPGGINGLIAINYFVTYTVRMTCVVVKESVEVRDPVVNPKARPIELPKDYYSGYVPSWWDQYSLYIIIGGIILCIVFIVGGFLSLPVIGLLMGGR